MSVIPKFRKKTNNSISRTLSQSVKSKQNKRKRATLKSSKHALSLLPTCTRAGKWMQSPALLRESDGTTVEVWLEFCGTWYQVSACQDFWNVKKLAKQNFLGGGTTCVQQLHASECHYLPFCAFIVFFLQHLQKILSHTCYIYSVTSWLLMHK